MFSSSLKNSSTPAKPSLIPDNFDANEFDNLSEAEKIKIAKTAIAEYLKIMEHLTREEKRILAKALTEIRDQNIAKIKQQIMQLE